jgi:hypothetical protein
LLNLILWELKNKNLEEVINIYKFSHQQLLEQGFVKSCITSNQEINDFLNIENPYSYLYNSVKKIKDNFLAEFNIIIDSYNSWELSEQELFNIFQWFSMNNLDYLKDYLWLIELDKPNSVEQLFTKTIYNFKKSLDSSKEKIIQDWENKELFKKLYVKIKFFSYFIENSLWYELLPKLLDDIKKIEKRINNVLNSFSYKWVSVDTSKVLNYKNEYLLPLLKTKKELLEYLRTYVIRIGNHILLNNKHLFNFENIENFEFPDDKDILELLKKIDLVKINYKK